MNSMGPRQVPWWTPMFELNTQSASGIFIHALYGALQPLLNAKLAKSPPDNTSWYTIECLFQITKEYVLSACYLCAFAFVGSSLPPPPPPPPHTHTHTQPPPPPPPPPPHPPRTFMTCLAIWYLGNFLTQWWRLYTCRGTRWYSSSDPSEMDNILD